MAKEKNSAKNPPEKSTPEPSKNKNDEKIEKSKNKPENVHVKIEEKKITAYFTPVQQETNKTPNNKRKHSTTKIKTTTTKTKLIKQQQQQKLEEENKKLRGYWTKHAEKARKEAQNKRKLENNQTDGSPGLSANSEKAQIDRTIEYRKSGELTCQESEKITTSGLSLKVKTTNTHRTENENSD